MEPVVVLRLPMSWGLMGTVCLFLGGGVIAVIACDGLLGFGLALVIGILLLAVGVFCLYGFLRFRVAATREGITYRPLLGRTQRYAWAKLTLTARREFRRIDILEVYVEDTKVFDITSDCRNYQPFVECLREKSAV